MVRAYQIPEEVNKAMNLWLSSFDDNGEQIDTDEVVKGRYDALKSIENRKNEVAEWAIGEYANLTMSAESLANESKRISSLAKSEEKKAERLLSLVRMIVGTDVEDKPAIIGNCKVGYQNGTGSLVIDENAEVPAEFKRFNSESKTLGEMIEKYSKEELASVHVVLDGGSPDKMAIKEEIVSILESDEYKRRADEARKQYDAETQIAMRE